MARLFSYLVLLIIRSSAEKIIAAFFIGLIPGIIDRKGFLTFLYALAGAAGWMADGGPSIFWNFLNRAWPRG